jgi:hypothetical protein
MRREGVAVKMTQLMRLMTVMGVRTVMMVVVMQVIKLLVYLRKLILFLCYKESSHREGRGETAFEI